MIQKVKRDTLSNQVARGLIEFIDAKELLPGDSLPSESQLAEEFGVSRPVVREALRMLQGEGFIEIITGRNAVIQPVSSAMLRKFFSRALAFQSASFRDLIEVRRGLEIQSARLAAERCADADLAQMRPVIAKMRETIRAHDHYAFAEQDVTLHLLIAAASRNPMILHLIESIRDAMRDNVLRGLKHRFTDEEYQQVQICHEALVEAIANHDPLRAQLAMEEHFDEALKALLYGEE